MPVEATADQRIALNRITTFRAITSWCPAKIGSETIKNEELMDGKRQMGRKDGEKENETDKVWTGKKNKPGNDRKEQKG